jgi:hypothetical protein
MGSVIAQMLCLCTVFSFLVYELALCALYVVSLRSLCHVDLAQHEVLSVYVAQVSCIKQM